MLNQQFLPKSFYILKTFIVKINLWGEQMSMRLSKLFGMDIYTVGAEYKGKVFDVVINLEKGRLETITTEALKARSKQEAKKIISEKSIPYKNVKSAKDILLISGVKAGSEEEEEGAPVRRSSPIGYGSRRSRY